MKIEKETLLTWMSMERIRDGILDESWKWKVGRRV